MKISVVMPVFNEAELVTEAIECVLYQTEKDWECIVVNDGSTDQTGALLEQLAAKDRRIRVIHTPHQGIVASLNLGLAQSNGEYLARMDADDLCHAERLEQQAAYLDEHADIGLVSCLTRYGGDALEFQGLAHYVDWTNEQITPNHHFSNRFIESPIIHPTVMFRRAVWQQHGGYEWGNFPEDYQLWLRWMGAGVAMTKIPRTLFTWREREGRLTRTDPRLSTRAFFNCKSLYLARWLAENNEHHPEILVWGAGKMARKRLASLRDLGIGIAGFIDVDPQKIGKTLDGVPVISYEKLPQPNNCFILSFVGNRGARARIEEHLLARGFVKGKHYICGA